jgi:hypothetical protein
MTSSDSPRTVLSRSASRTPLRRRLAVSRNIESVPSQRYTRMAHYQRKAGKGQTPDRRRQSAMSGRNLYRPRHGVKTTPHVDQNGSGTKLLPRLRRDAVVYAFVAARSRNRRNYPPHAPGRNPGVATGVVANSGDKSFAVRPAIFIN